MQLQLIDKIINYAGLFNPDIHYPANHWEKQHRACKTFRYYYSGEVLGETMSMDLEAPLKYPYGINKIREYCDMHASYLWGSTSDNTIVVKYRVTPPRHEDQPPAPAEMRKAKSMEEMLRRIWGRNEIGSVLDAAGIACMVDGGTFFRTVWDPYFDQVNIEAIENRFVFPRWHPTNVNKLLEVILAYPIQRINAQEVHGLAPQDISQPGLFGHHNMVLYWERWTPDKYQVVIDGQIMRDEPNPYGFVPWVYIPRYRITGNYYGPSLVAELIQVQNQFNERLGDIGDGLNYAMYPLRWIRNYQGNVDDIPIGADSIIDLGPTIGDQKPEMGELSGQANIGTAQQHIMDILEQMQEIASIPPVAQGKDEGSQRSGSTLLVRFSKLSQMINRYRLYWHIGLTEICRQALRIYHLQGLAPEIQEDDIENYDIHPIFLPIVPKDRQDLINENIQLVAAGLRHPIEAMRAIGIENAEEEFAQIREYQKQRSQEEHNRAFEHSSGDTDNPDTAADSSGFEDRSMEHHGGAE